LQLAWCGHMPADLSGVVHRCAAMLASTQPSKDAGRRPEAAPRAGAARAVGCATGGAPGVDDTRSPRVNRSGRPDHGLFSQCAMSVACRLRTLRPKRTRCQAVARQRHWPSEACRRMGRLPLGHRAMARTCIAASRSASTTNRQPFVAYAATSTRWPCPMSRTRCARTCPVLSALRRCRRLPNARWRQGTARKHPSQIPAEWIDTEPAR
jgi:hypothetical protein